MTPLESKVRELVGRILYGGPAVRDCEKKDVDEATTSILALIEGEVETKKVALRQAIEAMEASKVLTQGPSYETADSAMVKIFNGIAACKKAISSGEGK